MGLTDSLYPLFNNILVTVINSGFVIIKSFKFKRVPWWLNGLLVVQWAHGGKSGKSWVLNSESVNS